MALHHRHRHHHHHYHPRRFVVVVAVVVVYQQHCNGSNRTLAMIAARIDLHLYLSLYLPNCQAQYLKPAFYRNFMGTPVDPFKDPLKINLRNPYVAKTSSSRNASPKGCRRCHDSTGREISSSPTPTKWSWPSSFATQMLGSSGSGLALGKFLSLLPLSMLMLVMGYDDDIDAGSH